jgi:hypothetical protein
VKTVEVKYRGDWVAVTVFDEKKNGYLRALVEGQIRTFRPVEWRILEAE